MERCPLPPLAPLRQRLVALPASWKGSSAAFPFLLLMLYGILVRQTMREPRVRVAPVNLSHLGEPGRQVPLPWLAVEAVLMMPAQPIWPEAAVGQACSAAVAAQEEERAQQLGWTAASTLDSASFLAQEAAALAAALEMQGPVMHSRAGLLSAWAPDLEFS